jgi:hypothetical protein
MCRLASATFLGSGFAWRPSLQNPLDLMPTWRQVIQWLFGFGRDKKSAMTFFKPGKYKSCTLNSEMNAKWRCCLGEMRAQTREICDLSKVEKLDHRKNDRNVFFSLYIFRYLDGTSTHGTS